MLVRNNFVSVNMTLPAGTYWVGDLCYILSDIWDEVCDLYWASENETAVAGGEFTLRDGRKFAMYGTRFGDGTYNDQSGHSYGVDSGTLGCFPVSADDSEDSLGKLVNFRNDFSTGYTDRDCSVIKFGHIQIDTGDFADEDSYAN